MAISDDWSIDYINKRVYHSANNNVYTVNDLYSWIMDTFDELAQMDDPVPMSAQTPTEYTFINEWFIDDESVKYLKEGAIKTSGYNGKIQVLKLAQSGYTNCIAGDIGKMVTDDGANTGNLLAYDNTIRKWWIRWTTTIADTSAMLIAAAVNAAKSYNGNTATYTNETADINSATANDVILPPIQITTLGDAIFFGDVDKFGRIRLNVGTAGDYAGATLQWQYWNGAWVELTGVTDDTSFFTVAGTNDITWTPPADWATTDVDGVTKYWIKCVVTVLPTSITTAPLGTQGWQGTGAGTADGASVTGEDLYANVYTLGTLADTPNPQVYIFQAGEAIAEWSDKTNWDRGHIDVAIKVKEAGTEIDEAKIVVYARQEGDLFDHFDIDLTTGGRNAVPLATAADLDNTTGDYYLLYDAETAAFTTIGQIITGGTSGATAELVAVTDWGTTGYLTLRGIKGTFQDNETITGSTEGSAAVNGTVGDTYLAYDAETGTFTVGLVVTGGTSTAKRILRGLQDDGTTGKMVLQVSTTATGTSRDPYYKAFQDDETITDTSTGSATSNGVSTTIISGWDDITIAFVNGTATYTTHGATEGINGERVTFTGGEGILLLDDSPATATGTITLGNMTITAINGLVITGDISGAVWTASQDLQSAHTMQKAFEQQANKNYDVIINAGSIYNTGRTLAQCYEYFKFACEEDSTLKMYTVVGSTITPLDGEEYIIAHTGYTAKKTSPLGTFAGGKFFGAQGVWIEGMATGQAYQFIDSDGAVQDPPVSATMKVTAVVSGDRVGVYLTSAGDINKSQYNSHDTLNVAGDTDFEIEEDIAQDTPSSGKLRVVDDDGIAEFPEQRYRYASWTGKIFTLETGATGTADAGSSGDTLYDADATFTTTVKVGDVIRNTTDNSEGYVYEVTDDTHLKAKLFGGTGNNWDTSDAYDTNKLYKTYGDGDTAYVPLIDDQATGTSIEQSVLYYANRAVMIRVRKKGIVPFETAGTFVEAGLTVAAIRTTDAIVT